MRLDRALAADLSQALRSGQVVAFGLIELAAGALFVARRGLDVASVVLLIWSGMLALAFFAWWAGRHPRAHPQPDPVPAATAKATFALMGSTGMVAWGFGLAVSREGTLPIGAGLAGPVGLVLFACGLGGWLWAAVRSRSFAGLWERLTRDPRPFLPLLLLIGAPRLIAGGPAFVVAAILALPSGIGQQLLYLVGLYAPLEALRGHAAAAAVASALIFGLIHVPFLLEPNGGDVVAALANSVLFQASVGLVACLAYQRHRAFLPLGVAHALAIG